jgi:putative redox protein
MSIMNATVHWHQKLTFTGTADTGFDVPMGAPPNVGGDSDGFKPIELMLVSLGGCTAMDVISILQKKRQDVHEFDVKVVADRAEDHPRVFRHITLEFIVKGKNIDQDAVQRAVELSAEKYCAAQAMLGQVLPIEHKITIEELESE